MSERDVLQQYSTPGLKRNELTRDAKRDHLLSLGVPRSQVEVALDRIYKREAPPIRAGNIAPEGAVPVISNVAPPYIPDPVVVPKVVSAAAMAKAKGFTGDPCPTCQSLNMVRTGTCVTCQDCGNNSGCG